MNLKRENIPDNVVTLAEHFISKITGSWPEDSWLTLSASHDLNVWSDEEGNNHADIYAVVNGSIDTSNWYRLK